MGLEGGGVVVGPEGLDDARQVPEERAVDGGETVPEGRQARGVLAQLHLAGQAGQEGLDGVGVEDAAGLGETAEADPRHAEGAADFAEGTGLAEAVHRSTDGIEHGQQE